MSGREASGVGPGPGRVGGEGGAREPGDAPLKVLYVMGYGRSGSTVLDVLLNNAATVTSVGALSNYWLWLERDLPCACGASLPDCPMWGRIVPDHLGRLPHDDLLRWNEVQEGVERRHRLPRLLTGRLPEELLGDYRLALETLLAEVRERVDTPAVVDSSGSGADKTGRPYALARHTRADVRVIHLVRDGRAVAWSGMKGRGSPERPEFRLPRPLLAIRFGVAWSLANLTSEWIARRLPAGRVLRVRYEDLATDPVGQLRRIGGFAGMELEDLVRKVEADEPLAVGHNVAGNRLRFREEIRIRPDFSWRERMSAPLRWVLTAQLWPLLLRYGYLGAGGRFAAADRDAARSGSGA